MVRMILFFMLWGALVVRLWGINFGLPHSYFGDEGYLTYWAFYSGSHALRPPYYLYAPLLPTILLIEFALYYVGGYLLGLFSSPSQFFISYLIDPTAFFLIGRITMAIVGVSTVWLLFIVGKKFFNERIGLLASFLLAFSFLHVKESHYIKQDVLMAFFVLASFYFALNILQKGRLRDYLLCGITFALAFGVKYHAVLMVPIILSAHLFNRKRVWLRLVFLGAAFFVTFSLIHPYFIIETKSTIEQALPVAAGSRVVYSEHLQGKSVWWWYMFEHIPKGIGHPLFIAAVLGFAICFFRGRRQRAYFFIPLLPFIFFITIDFFTKMHFARYAVMILPFIMLAAAILLDSLAGRIKHGNLVIIILAIVLTYPSFLRTVKFDTLLTKPDTRTLAKQWFEHTVPAGSKVLVELMAKPEHPANLNLPLTLNEKSIDKRIEDAEKVGQEALYLQALKQASRKRIGYDIISTTQVGVITDILTDEYTRIKDVSYYVNNDVRYIVLTSWVQEKMSQEFAKSLREHYKLIKEFRPTYEFNTDPHLVRVDYATLDSVDIFRKDVVFGPVIKIYKLATGPASGFPPASAR